MDKITDKIVKLRKHRKLSQKDMAERLGINLVSYSKYERGITALTVNRLEEIAEILDVDINYFFYEVRTIGSVVDLTDYSEYYGVDQEAEAAIRLKEEHQQLLDAIETLIKKIQYYVADISGANSSDVFFKYLRKYLNGKSERDRVTQWFEEFIGIYDLDAIKREFKDFFNILEFEEDTALLKMILEKYSSEEGENSLFRLMINWDSFFNKKLYETLFSKDEIYGFILNNQRIIKSLSPAFDYSMWVNYQKTNKRG